MINFCAIHINELVVLRVSSIPCALNGENLPLVNANKAPSKSKIDTSHVITLLYTPTTTGEKENDKKIAAPKISKIKSILSSK